MNRVFANLQVRTVSEDERIIEGVASSNRPDRMSDVVEPRGIVYALPTPFLMDHNHQHAVGDVEHIEVTDKEIRFRARIPKITEEGAAKKITDDAWSLIRGGLRKSVSIGFRPLAQERIDGGGYRFTAWELLELSACAVPAQPDARITATRAAHSTVKLNRPGHTVKLRGAGAVALSEQSMTFGRFVATAKQLNAARRAKGLPTHEPTWEMFKWVEDRLDERIPGRKAKREARDRARQAAVRQGGRG